MLYVAYLIILDGKSIKLTSFRNFHIWVAEAGKLHQQVVCPKPLTLQGRGRGWAGFCDWGRSMLQGRGRGWAGF